LQKVTLYPFISPFRNPMLFEDFHGAKSLWQNTPAQSFTEAPDSYRRANSLQKALFV